MSEVVIGNDEESLTNNNNASNETSSKTTKTSTPAYISMLSVLKNPPKILTISPLLRIKLPPCSLTTTALDKEKEDKEQHYIGSLLSLLTTSFMWEDTQSRCVDIFAASYYTGKKKSLHEIEIVVSSIFSASFSYHFLNAYSNFFFLNFLFVLYVLIIYF